ncbi:DUF190 domain-containing protein [Cereibacter azotoformans]|uniref:Uncharacterized protein n=1 Tax=Cereibacter azotoformans TaxID=43057 RepID=A0A2T5JSL9_9RHOB|nr:DUF190 domain-containing protein [Cereibacter azotoformans]AXQ95456.1 hypothetical protein D0Z66_16800 [Cereibacter sphaeroides]PTR11601.1 hypothetical protein C8J28_12733 [Cereibacter azotoformans]UIJ32306.1 DUF190 domain-containing protein [Cereibacter azotoformans]
MRATTDAALLRLMIGESDGGKGRPMYKAPVFKAREPGLVGATVLRGAMGFGRSSRMHGWRSHAGGCAN